LEKVSEVGMKIKLENVQKQMKELVEVVFSKIYKKREAWGIQLKVTN